MVRLLPMYRQKLKRMPVLCKRVRSRTADDNERLKGCFLCTGRDVFFDSCVDPEELTETIIDYMKFCENLVITERTITHVSQ